MLPNGPSVDIAFHLYTNKCNFVHPNWSKTFFSLSIKEVNYTWIQFPSEWVFFALLLLVWSYIPSNIDERIVSLGKFNKSTLFVCLFLLIVANDKIRNRFMYLLCI